MIYIVYNERKHIQSRTIVVFTDYIWKQKVCCIGRQLVHLNVACEILSEVSCDKQISTGWNFRLCVTDKFNTDVTISSNKHDNRL
jgi:hypothetical protein